MTTPYTGPRLIQYHHLRLLLRMRTITKEVFREQLEKLARAQAGVDKRSAIAAAKREAKQEAARAARAVAARAARVAKREAAREAREAEKRAKKGIPF